MAQLGLWGQLLLLAAFVAAVAALAGRDKLPVRVRLVLLIAGAVLVLASFKVSGMRF
ncbi:MAG: hypothetical protein RL291_1623 [Pseudomonadota bacterium]|jgi:hypothetical protein